MASGSVWFRAAIGRRKNAEARWLLPMICRRGGIDKQDIGAIRILDTTTEFEISERVAESFAVKIRRPDKEDNIRIEPLTENTQASRESRADPIGARRHDSFREDSGSRPSGKSGARKHSDFGQTERQKNKPTQAVHPQRPHSAKPAGRKSKKRRH